MRPGGKVPDWVSRRLDRAIEKLRNEPIILLSGGTTHRPPPLDENGFPIFESHAGARYLLDRGVPAAQILTEIMSWDTIGNAYFGKLIHIDPLQAQRLLVINSEFHASRCEAIFRWVFGLDRAGSYEWTFETIPDRDTMPAEVWEARMEKERAGLRQLEPLKARINDLQEFRRWLFTEHAAYAGVPAFRPAPNGPLYQSY